MRSRKPSDKRGPNQTAKGALRTIIMRHNQGAEFSDRVAFCAARQRAATEVMARATSQAPAKTATVIEMAINPSALTMLHPD
jgi:hypothetical protein